MSKKPISLKFVLCIVLFAILISWYISLPKEKVETKSYLDQLETREQPKAKKNVFIAQPNESPITQIKINQPKPQIQLPILNTKLTYNELLDALNKYPINNPYYIQVIVNKILEYKDYNADLVEVKLTDNYKDTSKTEDTQMVANFDFKTGNLFISKNLIYSTDKRIIIAILIHELDHFDKLAKVCKYMGIDKFKELFEENRIPNIDTIFWTKASKIANIEGFDGEYYKEALKRFLGQYDLELLSSYSDFYRMSENMRNPLEISAYKESDDVYNYYGLKVEEGLMRKLIKQFNACDWAIHNTIEKYPLLQGERISVFDYFFMQSIIKKFPQLNKEFNLCENQKDGDLTTFWLAFESRFKSFYKETQMDKNTFDTMFDLLKETENLAQQGLTPIQASEALKYKINTLINNLVYPKAEENLEKIAFNYLKLIKENNVNDEKQELKCIITLICIYNKLYKNNNTDISLYYIKIPEQLLSLYKIQDKKKFLLYLYKMQYFKSLRHNNSESHTLMNLINQNRLDIKVKN